MIHGHLHVVAGQEKPHICIRPLYMYFISNIKEELCEISFIHIPGSQLHRQKPINVFEATEHVLTNSYKSSSDVLLSIHIQGPKAHMRFFPTQQRYM